MCTHIPCTSDEHNDGMSHGKVFPLATTHQFLSCARRVVGLSLLLCDLSFSLKRIRLQP